MNRHQLGWWLAAAFGAGLVVGAVAGYVLFGVLLIAETHHQAAPAHVAASSCPLPYPGQVVPPGCPTQ